MSFKKRIFILCLTVIVVTSFLVLSINRVDPYETTAATYKPGQNQIVDQAIKRSVLEYQQQKKQGVNFSTGPCLDNMLMSDWVADTVHNPRIADDNLPENQCAAYLEGKAHHFIELDINGNFVRSH